jgi:uncharacterized protein (DUF58 family)
VSRARSGVGLLAVCVIAAAWVVGSTAVAVLGTGLAFAALLGYAWKSLVLRSLAIERRPLDATPVEGEPLRVEAVLRGRRWLASRIEWHDSVGALGERAITVGRDGTASLVVDHVPRGRYALGPGRVVAHDPFGLVHAELELDPGGWILVRPRVPQLETLFTDSGAWGEGGRQHRIRRPSGPEPHGVREYVEGEPLRAVHWPTSARRGDLMVRDLEDAPRDSVAVLLDVDEGGVAGPPGESSLDEAVRVAAGITRAHAARSRRALLVIGAPKPGVHRIRSLGRDWEDALDALAGAEPARATPLRELASARGVLGTVPELVVVTARPEVVVDALVARAAVGRSSALVAIDAPTYAGRTSAATSPSLLRLTGAGVALAVVRQGVPLEEALGSLRVRGVG